MMKSATIWFHSERYEIFEEMEDDERYIRVEHDMGTDLYHDNKSFDDHVIDMLNAGAILVNCSEDSYFERFGLIERELLV